MQNQKFRNYLNTNTELDEEALKKIINSGLDILIYSFDGGLNQL